ncbi:uncharacterized protein A4U43_C01F5660 [Asparagus officinalis]|uniref:Uncharacterized protein n=1 Tax=Asparagus officinalis TaxID=4686 RepID=A0A5P1FQV0_ASPOF|nr:uncharacterized protein A4U43_C01F5660 [Asparagus officinalis]
MLILVTSLCNLPDLYISSEWYFICTLFLLFSQFHLFLLLKILQFILSLQIILGLTYQNVTLCVNIGNFSCLPYKKGWQIHFCCCCCCCCEEPWLLRSQGPTTRLSAGVLHIILLQRDKQFLDNDYLKSYLILPRKFLFM